MLRIIFELHDHYDANPRARNYNGDSPRSLGVKQCLEDWAMLSDISSDEIDSDFGLYKEPDSDEYTFWENKFKDKKEPEKPKRKEEMSYWERHEAREQKRRRKEMWRPDRDNVPGAGGVGGHSWTSAHSEAFARIRETIYKTKGKKKGPVTSVKDSERWSSFEKLAA